MFDIGWTEMVVVVVLAIIIIGPKDLPKLIRTIGQWTSKARALAREFQSSIDDIAREAGVDEIKKSVQAATKFDIKKEIEHSIDPTGGGLGLDGAFNPSAPADASDDAGEANGPDSATGEPDATLVEPEAMQSELDAKQAEWAAAAAPPHSVIPPEDPFADRPSADADAPEAAEAPAEPATVADDETDAGAAVKSGVGG